MVVIWVAAVMTMLMGGMALAIDVGLAFYARNRLGSALDAAGLAMGAAPSGTATTELERVGQLYLNQNFGNDAVTGQPVALKATFSPDLNTISVSATTSVPTNFARLFGFQSMAVSAGGEIKRRARSLELAMVLDNTGSMWSNNNIQAVRDSATNMISILFGDNAVHPNLKIGIVPYSVAVNVAPVANSVVAALPHPLDTANFNTEDWKGCVIERPPPYDTQDATTAVGGYWTQYWWPSASGADNKWKPAVRDSKGKITQAADIDNDTKRLDNGVHGPNIGCPTPIIPLTNVKQTLTDAIGAMTAWNRGGTMSNVGMAWGLRLLSPEPPLTEGVAWSNQDWQKAVVLMTDGDNLLFKLGGPAGVNEPEPLVSSDWSAYGRIDSAFAQSVFHTKDLAVAKDILNSKLTSVCQDMKSKNIIIYTVVFTSGITAQTRQIYQDCATKPSNYFYAPSQSDLRAAFTTIGNELNNLRISK
jgi:Flp pilus assembly protein TadG